MKQHRFAKADGSFDYDLYKRTQTEGNKNKIDKQWVDEKTIQYLSSYILSKLPTVTFGLCHGTRQGFEQAWFSKHLNGAHVIGTEISDTAASFKNTVQHDFHDVRSEWVGKADFVYSNSWDHAYDPVKCFTAWVEQLKPTGLLILEHTPSHVDSSPLDPFGADIDELVEIVNSLKPEKFSVVDVLKDAPGISVTRRRTVPTQYVVGRYNQ